VLTRPRFFVFSFFRSDDALWFVVGGLLE